MEKFFVVARKDLDPGLFVAQACHAAYVLGMRSPKEERTNIAVLATSKENLESIVSRAKERGICHEAFYEPDLNDKLTACAIDGAGKKLTSSLPKAFKPQAALAKTAL